MCGRPDAFLPDLATSLNNLSVRLGDLGRREDALAAIEEAVTAYRRLAEDRPDAFLPDLATSLWAVGWVCAACRFEWPRGLAAVEEAIGILGDLTRTSPAAFSRKIAAVLSTKADILDGLGRRDEAAATRRQLAGDATSE